MTSRKLIQRNMNPQIRLYFFLLFWIVSNIMHSQNYLFDLTKVSLEDCLTHEISQGSQKIDFKLNLIGFSREAPPIVLSRKSDVGIDVVTQLYFTSQDSSLTKIVYEWDFAAHLGNGNKMVKAPIDIQSNLIDKYNQIEKYINDRFSSPKVEEGDSFIDKKLIGKKSQNRRVLWNENNRVNIELYITISDTNEEGAVVTTAPTYRIRLFVRQPIKSKQIISERRLEDLEEISKTFFSYIGSSDFEEAKNLVEDSLRDDFEEDELRSLLFIIDWNTLKLANSFSEIRYDQLETDTIYFSFDNNYPGLPSMLFKLVFNSGSEIIEMEVVPE